MFSLKNSAYFYATNPACDVNKITVIRDLKIVVYGKRLTSDTLLAINTKSLTVKYITYRIYSKYRKLRVETPCLTTETWRLILNDFVLK